MLKKPNTVFCANLVRWQYSSSITKFNYNNRWIKGEESIKFIRVLLDQNVRKEHLKLIENKYAKSIGLLYKAKHHLEKKCLPAIYFS